MNSNTAYHLFLALVEDFLRYGFAYLASDLKLFAYRLFIVLVTGLTRVGIEEACDIPEIG
jgi:hypothetical protein